MANQKISALLTASLLTAPISLPPSAYAENAQEASGVSSSSKASVRRMKHTLTQTPTLKPMGTYVGQLQEKWQFPSDHLPIGMTFENTHIASWNVLDAKYMNWVIEKDSQGLKRSLIVDEHIYIDDSKLTVRDLHVIDLILETLSHPTHPRSLLALQESGGPFLEALQQKLPAHYKVVSHYGEALIYDTKRFELLEAKEVSGIFTDEPYRTVQDIQLRRHSDGQKIRLINVHLPGDPTKPARFQFTQYLADTLDPSLTTLAMGDMNFNEIEMGDAISHAFPASSPFALHSSYPTNISPFDFHSKTIDHFLVYSPNVSNVTINAPDQILSTLAPIAALLQEPPINEIANFAKTTCHGE